MHDSIPQSFQVRFDYPVIFTRSVFHPDHFALRDALHPSPSAPPSRAVVFVDRGLVSAQPTLPESIQKYFAAHCDALELVKEPDVLPGGEAVKNDYRRTMQIVDTILEYQLCRQSYVVAIGGGALLDAVGFAASLVHRGLRLVRMPSTTLAQNDAGIGVKNGMNLHGGKNTVGTFHPPHAVINDFAFLPSLPDEHWIGGVSEAIKVALIRDGDFFDQICADAAAYRAREPEPLERMIRRCAELHLAHIRESGDAFERGSARPLDFGHWAAHQLESMSGYRISHGAAVAVGVAIDTGYALQKGWLDEQTAGRVIGALRKTGFTLAHPELQRCDQAQALELLQGLDAFREHLGGELCITFPNGVGKQRQESAIDAVLMERAIHNVFLQAAARVGV